jgi:dolichol-phosphate mannosyltransferase
MESYELSLVIPTLNEADNIRFIVGEIRSLLDRQSISCEIVVVDDHSDDGTPEAVREMMNTDPHLKLVYREGERDLSTAAVAGWREAAGRYFGIIDADLQHPPEVIPRLLSAVKEGSADLAVASRNVAGGGIKGWIFYRKIISWAAIGMAWILLPFSLWKVKDPTSGCFVFDRKRVDLAKLKPRGFKILIELLVRGDFQNVREIPYEFIERKDGRSKLTAKQYLLYFTHVLQLSLATGQVLISLSAIVLFLFLFFR